MVSLHSPDSLKDSQSSFGALSLQSTTRLGMNNQSIILIYKLIINIKMFQYDQILGHSVPSQIVQDGPEQPLWHSHDS